MEKNEYFKLDIQSNFDNKEIFDISLSLDNILIAPYRQPQDFLKFDHTPYVPKPGDKLFFLPGVNIPRIKLKDLTLQYGIRNVRDIKDANVIFGSVGTVYKLHTQSYYYKIPVSLVKEFLELVRPILDSKYIVALETVLAYYHQEFFISDYRTKHIILNPDYPCFKTTIQNPVLVALEKYGDEIDYSEWYSVIDDDDDVKLVNKISKLNVKDESTLLDILNGNDAVIIDEEVFNNLSEMLDSSDTDNHVLAMEIMANSNYKESLMYLELLFEDHANNMSSSSTKNHVNFKSLLSYLGKTTSRMYTDYDDVVKSLARKQVLTVEKLNYIANRFQQKITYISSEIFKVKTITVEPEILEMLNVNYKFETLPDFEPIVVPEPEVIEQEEVVQQEPEVEGVINVSEDDFSWD